MTGAAAGQAIEAILLFYLLPGVLLAAFIEPEQTDEAHWRWIVEWPGCITREVRG
jgi:hypothetical protein